MAPAGRSISDNGAVESPHPIPLKTYRISPRKARIEFEGGAAELFLPTYFGRSRLCVPLNGLAVCDLTSPFLVDSPADDVFHQPIVLPYLFTTGPATVPTLLLLFADPQRVPPLRGTAAWAPNLDLPFGWKSSRSPEGAFVDGVLLRASHPAEASRRLAEAGATEVHDPAQWMREHRDRIVDPFEVEQVIAEETREVRLANVASAGLFASLIGAALIMRAEQLPLALLGVPAAAAVASLAVRRAATREPEGK